MPTELLKYGAMSIRKYLFLLGNQFQGSTLQLIMCGTKRVESTQCMSLLHRRTIEALLRIEVSKCGDELFACLARKGHGPGNSVNGQASDMAIRESMIIHICAGVGRVGGHCML